MQILAMKCPGCGAKLDVSPQIEFMNCGYCGVAAKVVREGGAVSLMRDSLDRISSNTDKTAAELALARLKQEAQELDQKIAAVVVPAPRVAPQFISSQPSFKIYFSTIVAMLTIAILVESNEPNAGRSQPIFWGCSILAIVVGEAFRFNKNRKRRENFYAYEEHLAEQMSALIDKEKARLQVLQIERQEMEKQIQRNREIANRV